MTSENTFEVEAKVHRINVLNFNLEIRLCRFCYVEYPEYRQSKRYVSSSSW